MRTTAPALASAAFALAACGPATEQVAEQEASREELRVCFAENDPPRSRRGGAGFDTDVARELAAQLDRRLVVVWLPEEEQTDIESTDADYRPLLTGQCHLQLSVPGAGAIERFRGWLVLSEPYYGAAFELIPADASYRFGEPYPGTVAVRANTVAHLALDASGVSGPSRPPTKGSSGPSPTAPPPPGSSGDHTSRSSMSSETPTSRHRPCFAGTSTRHYARTIRCARLSTGFSRAQRSRNAYPIFSPTTAYPCAARSRPCIRRNYCSPSDRASLPPAGRAGVCFGMQSEEPRRQVPEQSGRSLARGKRCSSVPAPATATRPRRTVEMRLFCSMTSGSTAAPTRRSSTPSPKASPAPP